MFTFGFFMENQRVLLFKCRWRVSAEAITVVCDILHSFVRSENCFVRAILNVLAFHYEPKSRVLSVSSHYTIGKRVQWATERCFCWNI